MHDGKPTKSVAATTGCEAACVIMCTSTVVVLARTIDSATTPGNIIVFGSGVHCRQHSLFCRLKMQETMHSKKVLHHEQLLRFQPMDRATTTGAGMPFSIACLESQMVASMRGYTTRP